MNRRGKIVLVLGIILSLCNIVVMMYRPMWLMSAETPASSTLIATVTGLFLLFVYVLFTGLLVRGFILKKKRQVYFWSGLLLANYLLPALFFYIAFSLGG